jgi:hypothetical protein
MDIRMLNTRSEVVERMNGFSTLKPIRSRLLVLLFDRNISGDRGAAYRTHKGVPSPHDTVIIIVLCTANELNAII